MAYVEHCIDGSNAVGSGRVGSVLVCHHMKHEHVINLKRLITQKNLKNNNKMLKMETTHQLLPTDYPDFVPLHVEEYKIR